MRRRGLAIILACAACALPATAAEPYLFDVIKKPAYARALTGLLKGARDLPDWTRRLLNPRGDYVAAPADYVTIEGIRYELFSACKPHACSDSRVEVMFAPNGAQAWAGVSDDGKPITWLGAPGPAQQQAMQGALQP